MPTLNIKDPKIYYDVQELARRRGSTMTDAVRVAVAEKLATQPDEHPKTYEEKIAEIEAIIDEIQADAKAHGWTFLTDDDLYDEYGVPK